VYDSEANTLRYDIVSENGTSIDGLPGEFGQYTLVIDNAGGDSNTATTDGDSNTATTEGDSNTATARGN